MAARPQIHALTEDADGPRHGSGGPVDRVREEASSLKTLFRQLGDDASTLMREELALAKLEMRREARALTADLVKVGIALGLAMLGALALTAFLILLVGQILDDAFWAGALIVGALFLLVGGVMAKNATGDLKNRSLKPEETLATLREDRLWTKQEAQEFRREVSG